VEISDRSSNKLYEKGIETMPSESVCYPGKMVHGHIMNLVEKGIKFIFYPCIAFEHQEQAEADNHFNCPIVASYPEVIKNNMDILREKDILFLKPFLPYDNKKRLVARLYEELKMFNISKSEIEKSVDAAVKEQDAFKKDIQKAGEDTLKLIREKGLRNSACRKAYHIDPPIHTVFLR
jgi:predicted nucleotide-binding protein (sugar kinase/HSP70/actin superfamily)